MRKKIRSLTLLMMSLACLFLQACIPAVIAAGVTTSGLVLNDRRDMNRIMSDKKTQQYLLGKFSADSEIRQKTHLSISVFNGTILIVGQAPTANLRSQAINMTQSIPHKRLYEYIDIEKPTSLQTRAEDTMITTKIKTAMLTTKGLQSLQIKIVTENHVIYLLGIVEPHQGHLAAEVARRVPGVKRVIKLFEYIGN